MSTTQHPHDLTQHLEAIPVDAVKCTTAHVQASTKKSSMNESSNARDSSATTSVVSTQGLGLHSDAVTVWENWPQPQSLRLDPLPPMPLVGVPVDLRVYVEALATAYQVPRDLALLTVLGTLGVACQGTAVVGMGPGWIEELAMFTMCVAGSGERKSPVVTEVKAPVEEHEREWAARTRGEVAISQARHAALVARRKAAIQKAAKAEKGQPHDEALAALDELSKALAESRPMITPRVLADDATPEALAHLLAEHERMGVITAEGGLIDNLAGRYSDNLPNLDAVLHAHYGESIRVDRRGGPPFQVARPLLSLAFAVQPDVMAKATGNPVLMGRGLIPRFLISHPASIMGQRQGEAPPVPPEIRQRWNACITELMQHSEQSETTSVCFARRSIDVIKLSPEAREVSREFGRIIERGSDPETGAYADLPAFAGKAHGLAGRIAGLLHLAQQGPDGIGFEIAGEVMQAAVSIVVIHLEHVRRIINAGQPTQIMRDARTIARWAITTQTDVFDGRDALTHGRGQAAGPQTAKRVQAAFGILLERDVIMEIERGYQGKGRPRGPLYQLNPHATEALL